MESKEIIKGIKESGIYNFVANSYWKLSKEDLKAIILELDYATSSKVAKNEYEEIIDNATEELEERFSY